MIRRLPSVLAHHKLIRLVVIIGGTNDLTQREDPHGLNDYAQQHSNLVLFRDFDNVFDQEVPASTHFWSDDLQHFSPAGYDEIGSLLYGDIVDFVYRVSQTSNGTVMASSGSGSSGGSGGVMKMSN
eukprot:gene31173-38520_t